MKKNQTFRLFAAYLVGFFLVMSLLTAFVILPQINDLNKRQHVSDTAASLQIEAELLRRFVEQKVTNLNDLASFPAVTNAVLLSSAEDANFVDLMDNFSTGGQRSLLLVQDVEGKVIYHTTPDTSHALGGDGHDFKALIEGKKPYHFKLLLQDKNELRFALSVAVTYHNNIEGILSAVVEVPIDEVFSRQHIGHDIIIKVRQGKIEAETSQVPISSPKAFIQKIDALDAELVLLEDQTTIIAAQNELRNKILFTLLSGCMVSFLAFMILGYRAFSSEDRAKFQMTKRAYFMPIGLGVLGVAVSCLATLLYYFLEEEHAHDEIANHNTQMIKKVEETFTAKLNILHYLAGLHESSHYVSRTEFKNFTQKIFNNHQHIQALEWVPIVKHEDRASLEARARSYGLSKFEIREKETGGKLIPAHNRKVYYPVLFAEPFENKQTTFGLDLGSNKKHAEAFLAAQTSGKPVATPPIPLDQGEVKQTGLLVFHPVYQSVAGKNKVVKGFVLGVFRLEDIVAKAKLGTYSDTLLIIEDVTDPERSELMYQSNSDDVIDTDHVNISFLSLAQRKWRVTAFPNPNNNSHVGQITPWFILLGGVIFSLFVSYALLQLVRRRQITEAVVVERTKKVRELTDAMEQTVEGVSRINPKGEYTYLNEAYASTCGYTPEELTGKDWTMTVHPDDHEMMDKAYETMLATGQVVEEPRGLHKNGNVFYKRVTLISRYDEDGEFIGHHCFMSDITQRKMAELELKHSNQELDDFAYIASHDLKEPLRGIHNHAKLFVEDHREELDEDGRHRLNRITYLSQRMENLINDLLYYSRLGRQETEFTLVDLNEVVIDAQKLLADQNDVAITIETKLPIIKCDKTRISELFRNLITNAVKYNDSETKNIAIGVEEGTLSGGEAERVFYVKDNGIGIDPRFHDDIFKIFKRLHKRDAYGGGTGSGLTFVKKIIEQHKGRIWLESEPGKGTAFYFTLER